MRNSSKSLTIELIHPPHLEAIEDRLDAPLGLLYIASMLEQHNQTVKVNDLSGQSEEEWQIGWADIYGITTYTTSLEISKRIANLCREKNQKSKIIVGGPHPTALPKSMGSYCDIVVIGEGELSFLDIIKDYPNNERFYSRVLSQNLDHYPNPAYDLVELNSYKRTIGDQQSLTMLTSRGCPFRCTFCGLPKQRRIVRYRSPGAVYQEITGLMQRYGIRKFNFQDDIFTLNKSRLYEILDLLKPLHIGFRCHGRAGFDSQEDYIRLKEAGCEVIAWGIESGSQRILDSMNKRATVTDNANAIRWAKEAGLTSRIFLIFGFPGETKETVEETKRFIEESDPDQYFVSNIIPFPGTEIWENPRKYGITWMNRDFKDYYQVDKTGFGGVNIETEFLSREEFMKLETEFRAWINKRERRGSLQEYEKQLEKDRLGTRK